MSMPFGVTKESEQQNQDPTFKFHVPGQIAITIPKPE